MPGPFSSASAENLQVTAPNSACFEGRTCKLKDLGGFVSAQECQAAYETTKDFALVNRVTGGDATLQNQCPVPVLEGREKF